MKTAITLALLFAAVLNGIARETNVDFDVRCAALSSEEQGAFAYHVKDPKSPETDPFAGTPQFEDMSRIHLHIQKMRLLDILYEIARQSNSRLRIPTPIIFEIGVDAIKKGEQGGGEERR